MKVKRNPDTAQMGKEGEAYRKQDKAPRKGVKADDQDEYQAKSYPPSSLSVEKSKAYDKQAKAPTGRGNRGTTQSDGGPISGWDKPVSNHGAYGSQEKWGSKSESASLGFKLGGEGTGYLGHLGQEKYLRDGHNTDNADLPGYDKDLVSFMKNTAAKGYKEDVPPSTNPSRAPAKAEGKNLAETFTNVFEKNKRGGR